MYKLIGYDKPSFNLSSILSSVGCINNRTIRNFNSYSGGGLLIWAYVDGLYIYDGSQVEKISSSIQATWDLINNTKYLNMDSTLDTQKGRYILTLTTGSNATNTQTIAVDLMHPWRDETGLHFPIFIWDVAAQSLNTEITTSTNEQRIVFGSLDDGIKNRFGTLYSDGGVAIDTYVASPLFGAQDGLMTTNALREVTTAWVTTAGEIELDTEINDGTDWVNQDTISSAGIAAAIGIDFTIGISPIGVPDASFTYTSNVKARSSRIMIRLRQISSSRYFNLQAPVELYFKQTGRVK